jgi:hypothetical protein
MELARQANEWWMMVEQLEWAISMMTMIRPDTCDELMTPS